MELKQSTYQKTIESEPKESWLTRDIQITPFKVKDKQKAQFYGQLNLLVRSGFDLGAAFNLLIEESKGKWQELLEEILNEVIQGKLLSSVLEENVHFTQHEAESLRIGEESGLIEEVFKELASFYDRKLALRRKFVSVMTYPIIVIVVSLLVIVFMLRIVVPMFEDMFTRFNAELPGLTKFVINASEAMKVIFPILLISVLILWLVNRFGKSIHWLVWQKERLLFSIPRLGSFIKKNLQGRFSQNMKLLLNSGTPLTKSLELTKNMLGNKHYEKALTQVISQVSEGKQLHKSLKSTKLFEPRALSLIRVGEEVNQLGTMFEKLEEQIAEEIDYESKQLSSIMEPLIMITLSIIVGVILIAMYMPILDMGKIIQ